MEHKKCHCKSFCRKLLLFTDAAQDTTQGSYAGVPAISTLPCISAQDSSRGLQVQSKDFARRAIPTKKWRATACTQPRAKAMNVHMYSFARQILMKNCAVTTLTFEKKGIFQFHAEVRSFWWCIIWPHKHIISQPETRSATHLSLRLAHSSLSSSWSVWAVERSHPACNWQKKREF